MYICKKQRFMLYDYQRGYSVRTRDLHAITFESQSLEDCKRFCRDDSVIVELIPIKAGFNLRVWLSDYNMGGVKYDKYSHCLILWKLRIQLTPEWKHKIGEIVYDPQKEKNITIDLKQQFMDVHNLDINTLCGKMVEFKCHTLNTGEPVQFIGLVNKTSEFYLSVEYPYYPDSGVCFCAEAGVSPNVEEPRAYYILEDYRVATHEETHKWYNCREKFIEQ